MAKTVPPSLGGKSFSCPHCGAFADQHWFKCWIEQHKKDDGPTLYDPALINLAVIEKIEDDQERARIEIFLERLRKNSLTYRNVSNSTYSTALMANMSLSRCHSCDGFTVWVYGSIVYPRTDGVHAPHEDTPADVKSVFLEAASIVETSPRGAAALLRLSIELLMPHLEAQGKDLNAKIGNLVQQGLDPVIQKAMDVVRVTGNNAVHPGQIDVGDDSTVAHKLFGIVNIIVATMISARTQIAEMFEALPEGAKAAIERRDATKPPPEPKGA